jgi:hypothetical protein
MASGTMVFVCDTEKVLKVCMLTDTKNTINLQLYLHFYFKFCITYREVVNMNKQEEVRLTVSAIGIMGQQTSQIHVF